MCLLGDILESLAGICSVREKHHLVRLTSFLAAIGRKLDEQVGLLQSHCQLNENNDYIFGCILHAGIFCNTCFHGSGTAIEPKMQSNCMPRQQKCISVRLAPDVLNFSTIWFVFN